MWKQVVERIRENAGEGRVLTYSEGAIGITALLNCPVKWELSQKHDVKASAVEIDDGFVWEAQVKRAFRELHGDVEEEKDLLYEVDGYLLHGHLDLFVEFEEEVWGIELKSPRLLLCKGIPQAQDGFYEDEGVVIHNPQYVKQAQIQRFLLERLYPHKRVRQFLFYKSLCKCGQWSQKLYVLSEVKESIQEEELKSLIRAFHEDKTPRYPNECESYCVFFKEGLCQGKTYEEREQNSEEASDLLKTYLSLSADLKVVESLLKKTLKGSVKVGDREIGWVRRKSVELDVERLIRLLPYERYPEVFQVKWTKKKDLIKEFGKDIVKEEKEIIEWRA